LTSTAVTATFSEDVQPATISMVLKDAANNVIAGTTSYDSSSLTATFTPTSALALGTTYTMTVTGAKDVANNTMSSSTWSFPTARAPRQSVFSPSATPNAQASGDAAALEVGMRFRSDVSGYVAGVRFYKSTANTGTHTGSLWDQAGNRLATGTFTNETASGW